MVRLSKPVRIIQGCVFGVAPVDAIAWVYEQDEETSTTLTQAERIVRRRQREVDDANGD